MPNYEHVFICRQDLTSAQAETIAEEFKGTLTDNGGTVIGTEYWGLRSIAYRMNKNRKGHYFLFKSESNSKAVAEMERLMNIHEDIMKEGVQLIITINTISDARRLVRSLNKVLHP